MIIGNGIDIVEISRVKQAAQNAKFLEKIFTSGEIEYCKSRKFHAASSFAGRFAAKEAVIKALNLGGAGKSWREIEILATESGCPSVVLHGECRKKAESLGVGQIHLSISHHETSAIAQVILCSK